MKSKEKIIELLKKRINESKISNAAKEYMLRKETLGKILDTYISSTGYQLDIVLEKSIIHVAVMSTILHNLGFVKFDERLRPAWGSIEALTEFNDNFEKILYETYILNRD